MRNKKVIAFLLAAAMLLTMSVTALAVDQYEVRISKTGSGTVSVTRDSGVAVASGEKVDDGTDLVVTASPAAGYLLYSLKAAGSEIESGDTVTVDGAHLRVEAEFVSSSDYVKLTYSVRSGGGSILVVDENGDPVASGGNVRRGSILTLRAKPGTKYELSSVGIAGLIDLLDGGQYQVRDDAAEVNISVRFSSIEEEEDPDDDSTRTDAAKPYVIISGYNYGGTLVAGETCELTMTFLNTSKTLTVENMKATISMPEALMLTSSSNSFYIEKLAAGGSVTKTVLVSAKPTAEPQSHEISVDFDYDYIDDKVRKSSQTSEKISMPVIQVDRFEVTGVEMDAEIIVGEEASVTVNFVNKGRSDVYNISAEISGNIQNPGQQQNLGNLTPGSTNSADFYIIAADSGPVSGEVTITYEDTNMQQKTKTIAYNATAISYEDMMGVYDPGMEDPGMMDPGMMEEPKSGLAWYWYALGAAVLGGGAFLIVRRRKIKKLMEIEDADI